MKQPQEISIAIFICNCWVPVKVARIQSHVIFQYAAKRRIRCHPDGLVCAVIIQNAWPWIGVCNSPSSLQTFFFISKKGRFAIAATNDCRILLHPNLHYFPVAIKVVVPVGL